MGASSTCYIEAQLGQFETSGVSARSVARLGEAWRLAEVSLAGACQARGLFWPKEQAKRGNVGDKKNSTARTSPIHTL